MKLKRFPPVERFVLQSNLSPAEILKRITDNIEPRKYFYFGLFPPKRSKPYEGVIRENKFEISRIIYFRNSSVPVILGNINNTEVAITMRPFVAVIIESKAQVKIKVKQTAVLILNFTLNLNLGPGIFLLPSSHYICRSRLESFLFRGS